MITVIGVLFATFVGITSGIDGNYTSSISIIVLLLIALFFERYELNIE